MTRIEEQELIDRARAMSEEEKKVVLRQFSSSMLHEELYIRDQEQAYRLNRIANVLNGIE